MLRAESLIALGLMTFGLVCMWYATALPIGWIEGQGPGGGAFPFWLGAMLAAASAVTLVRAMLAANPPRFFQTSALRDVFLVGVSLVLVTLAMPILGAYIAIGAFLMWYLRAFGRHGWTLTGLMTVGTLLVMFFFFEVTAKALMPKGITEPLFVPLYAIFF